MYIYSQQPILRKRPDIFINVIHSKLLFYFPRSNSSSLSNSCNSCMNSCFGFCSISSFILFNFSFIFSASLFTSSAFLFASSASCFASSASCFANLTSSSYVAISLEYLRCASLSSSSFSSGVNYFTLNVADLCIGVKSSVSPQKNPPSL